MSFCLNKNNKEYKQIEKEFGTTGAELLIRSYNNYSRTNDIIYPTIAELNKHIKESQQNQFNIIPVSYTHLTLPTKRIV